MFRDLFHQYEWQAVQRSIYAKTAADVERALQQPKRTLEDFKALISPAALPYLEPMARQSQALTQKRFGKTLQLYIPLYCRTSARISAPIAPSAWITRFPAAR